MLGAIIGDIVGSRFEFDNIKSKEFEFFHPSCELTDDSMMTLAIANALTTTYGTRHSLKKAAIHEMQAWGRLYPNCSYGTNFNTWLSSRNPEPYESYGNGAAMRVSSCAWAFDSMDKVLEAAAEVTEVTHNHEEGIKGARCVAAAIFLARCNLEKTGIKAYIEANFYPLDFSLRQIRKSYSFDETCQGTVPQAVVAFLESKNFEDAIRNAISIGGDSDTLAAITGSIAEAYYGIPDEIKTSALGFLDNQQRETYDAFLSTFGVEPDPRRKTAQLNRHRIAHAELFREMTIDQYMRSLEELILRNPEMGRTCWNDFQTATRDVDLIHMNNAEGIQEAFHSPGEFEKAKQHPESSYDSMAHWFTIGWDGSIQAIHDQQELMESINIDAICAWMANHPDWASEHGLDSNPETANEMTIRCYDTMLPPVRFLEQPC